ncbi:glutaminase A [Rhodococcus sp. NPDC058521]|uniref:glutaminase A n=1 Tax=Rhodococcus sp. NPDC058521 TaxID=3346536 RepID=UPI00364FAF08
MTDVVESLIRTVFEKTRYDDSGHVADYIPELAAVTPDSFGICLATVDGYVYEVGDTRTPFTIQSISKPFTYALALQDRGAAAVMEKIDVEPSGEPFNEISLDPTTERPRNPMINAGAITAASLIHGEDTDAKFDRIRAAYSRYAGRQLDFDRRVYESESRTGHRNRAIGHMLRSFGIITDEPDGVVDLYFRQCSLDVNCRDLALMATTLANNGIQPLTGDSALSPDLVEHVLSVMATCGMYDSAGEWITDVGLPAKSGVGGGILAVLPGQIGVSVYSPRLDEHGNSVRGVAACEALSRSLELHFLHVPRAARAAVRARYTVSDAPSRMRRSANERAVLDDVGKKSRIYELHGDLLFAGAETAVREIGNIEDGVEAVVVDVRKVDDVSVVARRMIGMLREELSAHDCGVALVDPAGLLGNVQSDLSGHHGRVFVDLDSALQWCEDLLLENHCPTFRSDPVIELREHPVLDSLDEVRFDRIARELEIRTFDRDETIVRRGDSASGLYLILGGRVSSTLKDGSGNRHRIMTLSAGMTFGEMTMLLGTRFLNDFRADTAVTAAVLTYDVYTALAAKEPELKLALVERLAAGAYEQVEITMRNLMQVGGVRSTP